MSEAKQKSGDFNHIRNMLLPVKENDNFIVRAFKNSVFYFAAVIMLIATFLLFGAILIAA